MEAALLGVPVWMRRAVLLTSVLTPIPKLVWGDPKFQVQESSRVQDRARIAVSALFRSKKEDGKKLSMKRHMVATGCFQVTPLSGVSPKPGPPTACRSARASSNIFTCNGERAK